MGSENFALRKGLLKRIFKKKLTLEHPLRTVCASLMRKFEELCATYAHFFFYAHLMRIGLCAKMGPIAVAWTMATRFLSDSRDCACPKLEVIRYQMAPIG